MLYFIPAWYQNNMWREKERLWYEGRTRTEFDDTVKQIQLFHRNGTAPYEVLILSYTPNLRHFLHRQGVFHAPYWSCFDAICEVKRKRAYVLSFYNLNWPENIAFVYTPFAVLGFLNGEKYAQIEFGEDGNPIQVDLFNDDVKIRTNIYDDRGFLSSTIVYKDGQPINEDYLTEKGIWKIRVFASDNHVEVNPNCSTYLISHAGREEQLEFTSLRYDSLDEVIDEVLSSFLRYTSESDIFCIAMHSLHIPLLAELLKKRKTILSFFEDRCSLKENRVGQGMAESTDYIISDSKTNLKNIVHILPSVKEKIIDITPYDSRVDFGISQQLKVQNILVPVDGLDDNTFKLIIRNLSIHMETNDVARVYLFTRSADYTMKSRLLDLVKETLGDEEDGIGKQFHVAQCVDELSVNKYMREQRIVVDLRPIPDLFLQISCISAGIPQIVRHETEYIVDGANGRVISDINELSEYLDYYLIGLNNWNNAAVHSYEIAKRYTTEILLNKWREVIDTVEQD